MNKIDQKIIDQVLSSADIVGVVSDYIKLTKAGANYKTVCPFHDDKDASLVVSPAKKIFKCFGCGTGGNAITFVQKHENMSFPEALKVIAAKYNVHVPERELSDEARAELQKRESLFIALQGAQDIFCQNVTDQEASTFLATRNFKPETIKSFGLGFAPNKFTYLTDMMPTRGYSTGTLISAGLSSQKGTRVFDRFINRITFPFFDMSGRIVGFTGRELPNDDKNSPKFLNSADSDLFKKGELLFGLYQARQYIQTADKVYLTEGQFDVMRLAENGYRNSICASGTALTNHQARLIKRFTQNVTIIYDGDTAGAKAAKRNADILLANGLDVRAAILPLGEDPDSFIFAQGRKKFDAWLKKNEVGFIEFSYRQNKEGIDDPILRTKLLEDIATSIAAVPSPIARDNYINHLASAFSADGAQLKSLVQKANSPILLDEKNKVTQKPGIYGLDEAKSFLKSNNDELTITSDIKIFSADWGARPTVFIVGKLSLDDIQTLRTVSSMISCRDKIVIKDDLKEPDILKNLVTLHKHHFEVMFKELIVNKDKDAEKEYKYLSLTEHYIALYAGFKDSTELNHTTAIKRCAELVSHADSTTRAVRIADYAKILGLTKGSFEDLIEPHLELRNSERKFQQDFSEDEELEAFSSAQLPDYIEDNKDLKKLYDRHGFYPLMNKQGRKVAYIFKHKNSFIRVGNFHIEPLLHIYDRNSEQNKRIVMLNQMGSPYPIYMEWVSKEMITYQTFRQRLWDEGDITFSNGSQDYLNTLNESWAGAFRRCTELSMYGYYDEGFFAFSNAIYHEKDGEWQVQHVDDLGLVQHNGLNYYIPVFSKIYQDERRGSDKYFLDRFVRYREPEKKVSFEDWAKLFKEVYAQNDNGMWGIIYAFMCAFRSDIFLVDRIFTALFFIGPTGSGKSEVAYSIRSLFMPPEAPIFNLNQGTDAAMFTLMEKYRDIPVIFDEYNDMQISDVKFQGLKAAVYDGEGKQKRKDASSKELDTSEINSPLLICGQEAPQRDDNSLANRSIIRSVPKKDNRTDHEVAIFRQLKEWEKKGLQNILIEILSIRPVIRSKYQRVQREVYKELSSSVNKQVVSTDGLSRILNTYSMFLATCRVIEQETDFKLPFTYAEFSEVVNQELLKQVESISSSNRLFNFFSIIDTMIDNGNIIEGRDFKIETPGTLTLQKQGRETYSHSLPTPETRVIHLRLNNIFAHYQRYAGKEGLSMQSLSTYLSSHESWVGRCRAVRFDWMETVETNSGLKYQADGTTQVMDRTMVRKRVPQKKTSSSIVLNYDILSDLLDIDYTRISDNEDIEYAEPNTQAQTDTAVSTTVETVQPAQSNLPFTQDENNKRF